MRSMTIKEALSQLKKGVLSVEDLCLRCQKRLEKTQALNMYVSTVDSKILSRRVHVAQQAYSRGMERPLEGVPIAFKDNFCTKGVATTCASKMLLNYIPPYSATMVTRSEDSGAVIMGKTNLDEFAFGSGSVDSCHGPVMNPWNLVAKARRDSKVSSSRQAGPHDVNIKDQRSIDELDWVIAGGSSGGSAAAVAGGTCLASFGSDTGGSVRIPASYCGVVGLKPTYGLLSRHGLIPMVNSMDVPGVFTKNVEDCSLIMNAVSGHDVHDSTTIPEQHAPFHINKDLDLSGLHIGIPKEYHISGLSEDVLDLWRDTADSLERAGARVSQVSMPHAPLSIICYHVLCCCEVASNFSRYDGIEYGLREGREVSTEELYAESRHKGFNDVVRGRILAGNFFLLKRNYEKFFIKAQKVRRLISNDFADVFSSGVDLVLIPTTKTDAPLYSDFTMQDNRTRSEEDDVFTTPANLAGVPGLTLPLRLSQRGLPLSLQLIGPRFSEGILLSVAHWLEQQAQFPSLDLDFLDDLDSSPS